MKFVLIAKIICELQRFLPSEFGFDVDHAHAIEPAASLFALKVKIRRMIEAEGIPYTYVICNWFADFFLPNLGQLEAKTPPRDKVVIFGDGNPKGNDLIKSPLCFHHIK